MNSLGLKAFALTLTGLFLLACPPAETEPVATCGDGQIQGDEACDDGNQDTDDRCLNDCTKSRCGDGFRQSAWEECDDGNREAEDSCLNDCVANVCGDGIPNPAAEACDDGNEDPTDRCADCEERQCGDVVFEEGETGIRPRDRVADFTVETLDGPWNYRDHVTGCDSVIILFYLPNNDYSVANWQTNPRRLLDRGPQNAHYLFISTDRRGAQTHVENQWRRFASTLNRLSEADQAAWKGRLHFVTTGLPDLGGWIAEKMAAEPAHALAIDRRQRLREIGLLRTVGSEEGRMDFLSHEAEYFNYEFNRDEALKSEDDVVDTVVALRDETAQRNHAFNLQIPANIADYDHLEIDLGLWCSDHRDDNCGEWDYIAHLNACDVPENETDPRRNQSCQQAIPASEGVEAIAAETATCNCVDPFGIVQERSQSCNESGTGFSPCNCGCGTQVARWITTYHREGRWVTNTTHLLALMQNRRELPMRLNSANSYRAEMDFRFSNKGKGARPVALKPLFSGGGYNATYNDKYEPIPFAVDADHRRVELTALITGHGHTAERENCAEFCNHTHHFAVNGGDAYVKEHPEAGDFMGCAKQIVDGVVPNQFGTWTLGRGGWCPGQDVKPWVVDLTADVRRDDSNTITYESLFRGGIYRPEPSGRGGGFGARMDLISWLVYWR